MKYKCDITPRETISVDHFEGMELVGIEIENKGVSIHYIGLSKKDAEAFAREILAKLGKD